MTNVHLRSCGFFFFFLLSGALKTRTLNRHFLKINFLFFQIYNKNANLKSHCICFYLRLSFFKFFFYCLGKLEIILFVGSSKLKTLSKILLTTSIIKTYIILQYNHSQCTYTINMIGAKKL